MEQMEYGSYSLGERKGGVFQPENVKNEDLELHDFTANQGVTFLFPNESKSAFSILLLQPCHEKKEFLRNDLGPGRIFENSRKKLRFRDSKSEHTCP